MATDETCTKIADAAGRIFAEKGYRDATVREICQAADVGLASVNYHFRDKQQLYARVVEIAFDYVREHRPPPPDPPAGTPVDDWIRGLILDLTQHVLRDKDDSWQDQLVTREVNDPTPACQDLIRSRITDYLGSLFRAFDVVFPPETPAHVRWRFAFSIMGQCMFYDVHRSLLRLLVPDESDGPPYQIGQLSEHISRVCLAALGLAPPLTKREAGGEQ